MATWDSLEHGDEPSEAADQEALRETRWDPQQTDKTHSQSSSTEYPAQEYPIPGE